MQTISVLRKFMLLIWIDKQNDGIVSKRNYLGYIHIQEKGTAEFDILYLSYENVRTKIEKQEESDLLFKPLRGLWQLSGYILSKKGAQKLLKLLPVRGPVDLWINHQFDKLNVFASN